MTWTHRICFECWIKKNPDRQPARVFNQDAEPCCFCGKLTDDGIYIRHDPNDLLCKHDDD